MDKTDELDRRDKLGRMKVEWVGRQIERRMTTGMLVYIPSAWSLLGLQAPLYEHTVR